MLENDIIKKGTFFLRDSTARLSLISLFSNCLRFLIFSTLIVYLVDNSFVPRNLDFHFSSRFFKSRLSCLLDIESTVQGSLIRGDLISDSRSLKSRSEDFYET